MHEDKHEQKLSLTILVNGLPQAKEYPAHFKVRQVIRDLLPAGDKDKADDYQLVDRDTNPAVALEADKSLDENGVKSGHTLSLTKKDGGGG